MHMVFHYNLFQLYYKITNDLQDLKNGFSVLSNRYFIHYIALGFHMSVDVEKVCIVSYLYAHL